MGVGVVGQLILIGHFVYRQIELCSDMMSSDSSSYCSLFPWQFGGRVLGGSRSRFSSAASEPPSALCTSTFSIPEQCNNTSFYVPSYSH